MNGGTTASPRVRHNPAHSRAQRQLLVEQRRERVARMYYTFGFNQKEIAGQLNVHRETIITDLAHVRESLQKTVNADDYKDDVIQKAMIRSEELVVGMLREASILKGREGVHARAAAIRAIKDQSELLRELGVLPTAVASANSTKNIVTEQDLDSFQKEINRLEERDKEEERLRSMGLCPDCKRPVDDK